VHDVIVIKFTFAVSSRDELLVNFLAQYSDNPKDDEMFKESNDRVKI